VKREIRASRGTAISCRGWQQEGALRMLMNNLDPEVAEDPENLVVYGGGFKAARSWKDYDLTVEILKSLDNDETLMVQSGKPVGVFRTFENAPRVILVNGFITPSTEWTLADKFRELEAKGLMVDPGYTAGGWFYIGTQGIIQGSYETLALVAEQKFGGSLKGKLVLAAGLGGMGRSMPNAIIMNEAVGIVVEVDKQKIDRSIAGNWMDTWTDNLDEALKMAQEARQKGSPFSVTLLANAADIYPEFVRRGIVPDIINDMTSAHDELNGYVPAGIPFEEAIRLRKSDPDRYIKMSYESIVNHCQAMIDLKNMGAVVYDYATMIRAQAKKGGLKDAFQFPDFVSAYLRPTFCECRGPFRWVALSGDQEDIYRIDEYIKEAFPRLRRWIELAQKYVPFQGLPARVCWLGHKERTEAALHFNELVRRGKVKAPIAIGRDHLDAGAVASPDAQTGNMKDGSDAVGDWPIMKALLNGSAGATWVALHSLREWIPFCTGLGIVADGTEESEKRLERVMEAETGLAVTRLADAGYEKALEVARKTRLRIPSLE